MTPGGAGNRGGTPENVKIGKISLKYGLIFSRKIDFFHFQKRRETSGFDFLSILYWFWLRDRSKTGSGGSLKKISLLLAFLSILYWFCIENRSKNSPKRSKRPPGGVKRAIGGQNGLLGGQIGLLEDGMAYWGHNNFNFQTF